MSRPLWLVSLIRAGFPGRFALAALTRWPLLGPALDKWLFDGDDMLILPSDRVVAVGRDVEAPAQAAVPSSLITRFIDEAEYHWVMNDCICRRASGCRDYPQGLGCLFLGEAARGINTRLGRRVSREEAHEHARRCREAGLVHLVGRNKLDAVWLGVGPGSRLLTICNCCPCCCLWKILPGVSAGIAGKVARMPGVSVHVNGDCTGCGLCAEGVCFVNAVNMQDGIAVIGGDCRGCGRCALACPVGAISVDYDHSMASPSAVRIGSLVELK
jgi:ferredoxin